MSQSPEVLRVLSHTPAPRLVVASQLQISGGAMRNASLEGVRGAAALVIVLLHAGVVFPAAISNGGHLCVDLFFVVSGFVICSAYRASLSSGREIKLFVMRRIGRLWPLHIATTVLFYAALNLILLISSGKPAGFPPLAHLAALATMTQGLNLFPFNIGTKVNWSVGDEFYVYLIFSALCFLLRGKARLAAFAAFAALGYVIAASKSVDNGCLHAGVCLDLNCSYGWSRCLAGFFIGALVAEFKNATALNVMKRRIPQCLAFGAVLLVMTYARVRGLALVAPLLSGAFVASLASDSGPVARFFQKRPFQYLGRISYSLYLGHPIVAPLYFGFTVIPNRLAHGVALAAFITASIALAHLLNYFIETPYRQRFNAWAETVSRPRATPLSSAQAT
jgi:peptidoglycan/LPS O-acetylase OafA/YrhL